MCEPITHTKHTMGIIETENTMAEVTCFEVLHMATATAVDAATAVDVDEKKKKKKQSINRIISFAHRQRMKREKSGITEIVVKP